MPVISFLRSLGLRESPEMKSSSKTPTFTVLVVRRDWTSLRSLLKSESGREGIRSEVNCSPHIARPLHHLCRFRPPLDIVRGVAKVFGPESVRVTDEKGRLPLHIATMWGASSWSIRFLVDVYPRAASTQDCLGKTPIHLAAESYQKRYIPSEEGDSPLRESTLEVFKALCKAAPDSINLEDSEDMTAIEYAVDSEVERKALRLLQKASERDWKRRRAESGGKRHEVLERSLLRQKSSPRSSLDIDALESAANIHLSLKNGDPKDAMGQRRSPILINPRRNSTNAVMA